MNRLAAKWLPPVKILHPYLDMELLVKDADGKYQLAGSDVNTHTTAPRALASTPAKTSSSTPSSTSEELGKGRFVFDR